MDDSKKTVAVVSPDKSYRRTLSCVLGSDSYAVKSFAGAGEFTAQTSSTEFDCLIVDTDFPESGLLARAHLDLAAYLSNEVPVILVSPEHSTAPRQLSLSAVTKTTPDWELLFLVFKISAKPRQNR